MTQFRYRRLHQWQWRTTRPARKDRREEDQAKTDFVQGLAKAAVNGYACYGEPPHPGCATRCPYYQNCRESLLESGSKVVVVTEEVSVALCTECPARDDCPEYADGRLAACCFGRVEGAEDYCLDECELGELCRNVVDAGTAVLVTEEADS